MSVKVAVRVRPFNAREQGSLCVVEMNGTTTTVHPPPGCAKQRESQTYAYDCSYWSIPDMPSPNPLATQEQIFNDLGVEIVNNAFEGYNGCFFVYGTTGSGKTYTMMGEPQLGTAGLGIIPRMCARVFDVIKCAGEALFRVEVSYSEIYNEKVRCLIRPTKDCLRVREHPKLGPYVEDLTHVQVKSYEDVHRIIHEGNSWRHTAETKMNEHSSRSHAVFTITLTQLTCLETDDGGPQIGADKVARISLVDLAGSERTGQQGASGARFEEGTAINRSLTTLGMVISALADFSQGKKVQFIPFRDSVLTWLMKDNLGGNCKTFMLATVSPAECHYEETVSTLRYADRAKRIVTKPVINRNPAHQAISDLNSEIQSLRAQLAASTAVSADVTLLRQHIEQGQACLRQLQAEWEEKLAQSHKTVGEREAEVEQLRSEKDRVVGQLQALRRAVVRQKEAERDLVDVRIQLEEKCQKMYQLETESKQLRTELGTAKQENVILSRTVEQLADRKTEYMKIQKEQTERISKLEAALEHAVVQAESAESTVSELTTKIGLLQSDLRSSNAARDAAIAERKKLEADLELHTNAERQWIAATLRATDENRSQKESMKKCLEEALQLRAQLRVLEDIAATTSARAEAAETTLSQLRAEAPEMAELLMHGHDLLRAQLHQEQSCCFELREKVLTEQRRAAAASVEAVRYRFEMQTLREQCVAAEERIRQLQWQLHSQNSQFTCTEPAIRRGSPDYCSDSPSSAHTPRAENAHWDDEPTVRPPTMWSPLALHPQPGLTPRIPLTDGGNGQDEENKSAEALQADESCEYYSSCSGELSPKWCRAPSPPHYVMRLAF
eukprot:TRINITY_DN1821_c0_g1_i1.p1 TRINITY_DN1821_c0_g1~~TRINITY_DN1821_c0_g1_i1.p1  ORF type:complete len:841 (+),score=146.34 TRINITY_DN1821_c0_g1_i1:62-2584(+)